MVQVNEGISIEIMSCFEHYTNTINAPYVICGIHVILLYIMTPRYLSLSVAVNIESPTHK